MTINVPIPITTGLQATASSPNGTWIVSVSWPAMPGATQYSVQRRSGSDGWQTVGTTTATSFTDTAVVASYTYAYQVTSNNGAKSDIDVATTVSFTQAVAGQRITAAPLNSMLDAVNRVRGAVGWPAVTWSNILAENEPLPAPGALITARQIIACRARMNEALQALGVVVHDYTDPDLFHLKIRPLYINEVEMRAQ